MSGNRYERKNERAEIFDRPIAVALIRDPHPGYELCSCARTANFLDESRGLPETFREKQRFTVSPLYEESIRLVDAGIT
jgi:hypothetical protein